MIGGKTDPESFGSCFRGDEEADGILMGRSEGLIYIHAQRNGRKKTLHVTN